MCARVDQAFPLCGEISSVVTPRCFSTSGRHWPDLLSRNFVGQRATRSQGTSRTAEAEGQVDACLERQFLRCSQDHANRGCRRECCPCVLIPRLPESGAVSFGSGTRLRDRARCSFGARSFKTGALYPGFAGEYSARPRVSETCPRKLIRKNNDALR